MRVFEEEINKKKNIFYLVRSFLSSIIFKISSSSSEANLLPSGIVFLSSAVSFPLALFSCCLPSHSLWHCFLVVCRLIPSGIVFLSSAVSIPLALFSCRLPSHSLWHCFLVVCRLIPSGIIFLSSAVSFPLALFSCHLLSYSLWHCFLVVCRLSRLARTMENSEDLHDVI